MAKSKTGSPLQSTRQMLDELDALMDRMLALPVGDVEELPPLPRDVAVSDKSTALSALAQITRTESTATQEEPAADPDARLFSPGLEEDLLDREPLPPSDLPPLGPRLDEVSTVAAPHFAPVEPRDEAPPPVVVKRFMEVRPAPLRPIGFGRMCLMPLVWINQAFDAGSYLLGPIGRGLRGERGRAALGIFGLLCLGLACAWFVFDHITWP